MTTKDKMRMVMTLTFAHTKQLATIHDEHFFRCQVCFVYCQMCVSVSLSNCDYAVLPSSMFYADVKCVFLVVRLYFLVVEANSTSKRII